MTKFVTLSIDRLNQVIEALNSYCNTGEIDCADDLVAELLAERDQKQGEQYPVAHMNQNGVIHESDYEWGPNNHLTALYTHSLTYCRPLTMRQIQDIVISVCDKIYPQDDSSYSDADSVFYGAFVCAVEDAHGIK